MDKIFARCEVLEGPGRPSYAKEKRERLLALAEKSKKNGNKPFFVDPISLGPMRYDTVVDVAAVVGDALFLTRKVGKLRKNFQISLLTWKGDKISLLPFPVAEPVRRDDFDPSKAGRVDLLYSWEGKKFREIILLMRGALGYSLEFRSAQYGPYKYADWAEQTSYLHFADKESAKLYVDQNEKSEKLT